MDGAPSYLPLTNPPLLQGGSPGTSTTPSMAASTSSAAASSSGTSPQDPPGSAAGGCPCRANLMLAIPKVKRAVRERRTDEVFKVTRDVMRTFQELIDCARCRISCTDLICIMALFQHTEPAFEHIAKVDLAGGIRVSIGAYQVQVADGANLRRMLVMDLVRQASSLLDSLSSMRLKISAAPPEQPCRLGKINLNYLSVVIDGFRSVLRSVEELVDDTGLDSSALMGELVPAVTTIN
jgi:hypothetical protein